MESRSVKRYPLSKQVSDELERMIEAGEYEVGSKIPTEVVLMDMFNVSRNTIREAIQSLTSAGVLVVKQGDGTYVRSSNRFNANMSMKYDQVSLEDITETRNALEITLAHLACQRRTEEDMEQITSSFLKRKELQETEKENTLADMEFHMAIAQASHNRILIDLYNSISSYMESHIAERQAETDLDSSQIDELHEKLYLAIKAKKTEEAEGYVHEILKI